MFRADLITLSIFLLLGLTYSSKLPSDWKICHRSDKDLVSCLTGAIIEAVVSLKNGNQVLGVLPLDPLHFDSLRIGQGTGPVNINLVFTNMDIHGISTLNHITNSSIDWDGCNLSGDATFSSPLTLEGDYSIDGQVLVLPIVGKGKFNLTFDDFVAKLSLHGREFTKGNKKYMEVISFKVGIETSQMHIHFENLFNGDKALGENMNLFINTNWKEILKDLKPSISKAFGEAFKQISNRVFGKIPIDEIAPK